MLCSLYARPSGNWERDGMDCFNLSFLSTEHAGEPSWIGGTHSKYGPQGAFLFRMFPQPLLVTSNPDILNAPKGHWNARRRLDLKQDNGSTIDNSGVNLDGNTGGQLCNKPVFELLVTNLCMIRVEAGS